MNIRLHRGTQKLDPAAARLVGNRTGLISDVVRYLPDRSDPAVCYATAIEPDLSPLTGGITGPLDAGATALHPTDALERTIGEAAERYCLYFPDPSVMIKEPYNDLSKTHRTIDPAYFTVFTDNQYRESGFDAIDQNTPIHWQPTTNLLTGDTVYVPGQWIWMGLPTLDEPNYYPTTSNGCACGQTRASALVRALAEYVERDAIMQAWYRRTSTRRIELAAEPRLSTLVKDRFETAYRSIRFFEIDTELDIPVVGCAAVDSRDRAPKFVVGGASSLTRYTAYIAALMEVAQTWVYIKDLFARGDSPVEINPQHIYNLRDNLRYYAQPDHYDAVEFLLGTRPRRPSLEPGPTTVHDELESYLTQCRNAGLTPLAVDVTTGDIRSVGYAVISVVVPELVDLALPSMPPRTHPALGDAELTTLPHPYP